jgi:hypothetical protein
VPRVRDISAVKAADWCAGRVDHFPPRFLVMMHPSGKPCLSLELERARSSKLGREVSPLLFGNVSNGLARLLPREELLTHCAALQTCPSAMNAT